MRRSLLAVVLTIGVLALPAFAQPTSRPSARPTKTAGSGKGNVTIEGVIVWINRSGNAFRMGVSQSGAATITVVAEGRVFVTIVVGTKDDVRDASLNDLRVGDRVRVGGRYQPNGELQGMKIHVIGRAESPAPSPRPTRSPRPTPSPGKSP